METRVQKIFTITLEKENASLKNKKHGGFFGFFRKKKEEPEKVPQNENWEEALETELERNKTPQKLHDSKLYFRTLEEQM